MLGGILTVGVTSSESQLKGQEKKLSTGLAEILDKVNSGLYIWPS